ncbi:DMT family transporter [Rubrimonas cliftonensis]|uniref:Permease of the drug/metabolite transporter (DMT) superfamily n=1 Tax=Rubrimonas cliftonensis TaxID=89524 RepID=A0A1H4A383_9RHOB|nr:DMT family transporter [Rubrimonas cliftonensis]SEA30320.1 Permease of the drug/metabolite transporter (DMT) superfamily [Rubrimonas cliftonensis]
MDGADPARGRAEPGGLSGVAEAAPDNWRGAVLLVAAAGMFTAEVVGFRSLGEGLSDGQIVFARAASQLICVAPLVLLGGWRLMATRKPGLHLARGLVSLLCWVLYYQSFRVLDLSLATTLTFSTSLFVVALAAPVLGERVGGFRWATTAVGFLGVALAAGALEARLEPGVLVGLGAAASGAVLVFLNRMLSRTEKTLAIMAWISVITTLGTAPVAALDWRPVEIETIALLLLCGALGTCGMFLTIEAYRVGEVSALAPFPYVRLVFAAAAGWLLFSETPDAQTIAGGLVIVGCALAATRRERRRGLAAPQR